MISNTKSKQENIEEGAGDGVQKMKKDVGGFALLFFSSTVKQYF